MPGDPLRHNIFEKPALADSDHLAVSPGSGAAGPDDFGDRLRRELARLQGRRPAAQQAPAQPQPPEAVVAQPDDFSERLARELKRHEAGRCSNLASSEPAGGEPSAEPGDEAAPPGKRPDDETAEAPETDAVPVGGGEYTVRQGDCIFQLARDAGHLWETVWDDPGNSGLREARKNPNVLLPGDQVVIPELRQKGEPGQSEMRHRFRRRTQPAMLRLVLQHNDQPRAGVHFTLEVEGDVYEGVTDAGGQIERPIPHDARKALLRIGENEKREIAIGGLDPVESITGVQQRLNNLGCYCGPVDGAIGPRTRRALRAFQKDSGLEPTGRADSATRARLQERHGS